MSKHYYSITLVFLIAILIGTRTFAQNVKAALINTFLDEANESSVFNGNILIEDGGK